MVSPTRRLADVLLGGDGSLDRFVEERRAAGRSWRFLVRDLYEATNGDIDVTYEALRGWYPHLIASRSKAVSA